MRRSIIKVCIFYTQICIFLVSEVIVSAPLVGQYSVGADIIGYKLVLAMTQVVRQFGLKCTLDKRLGQLL